MLAKIKSSLKKRFAIILHCDLSNISVMVILATTTTPSLKLNWTTISRKTDDDEFLGKVKDLLVSEMRKISLSTVGLIDAAAEVQEDNFFILKIVHPVRSLPELMLNTND